MRLTKTHFTIPEKFSSYINMILVKCYRLSETLLLFFAEKKRIKFSASDITIVKITCCLIEKKGNILSEEFYYFASLTTIGSEKVRISGDEMLAYCRITTVGGKFCVSNIT